MQGCDGRRVTEVASLVVLAGGLLLSCCGDLPLLWAGMGGALKPGIPVTFGFAVSRERGYLGTD